MWLGLLLLGIGLMVWRAARVGPSQALGQTILVAYLIPTWVTAEFWGFQVSVRMASAIAALGLYCVHPRAVFRTRLVLVDYLALALVILHLLSDSYHDGLSVRPFLQAYGEWFVPYVAGRLALRSWEDARAILPWALAVVVTLAIAGLVEALTGINGFESLFGLRPLDGPPRNLSRWGLKRAYGPVVNPIFLGMLELLLLPWALYAAREAGRGSGARWWLLAPGVAVVGVATTASRGPMVGLVIALFVAALVCLPRWRRVLAGIGLIAILIAAVNREAILAGFELSEGGSPQARRQRLNLSDGQAIYSSTMHRVYIWKVYRLALRRAGWLGYGTTRTAEFPPNVPMGPGDPQTLKRMRNVDNAYILMTLRFGYAGLACFVGLGFAAAWTGARLAVNDLSWQPKASGQTWFLGALAGVFAGTAVVLVTVWLSHDFGFCYLWGVGGIAGLRAQAMSGSR